MNFGRLSHVLILWLLFFPQAIANRYLTSTYSHELLEESLVAPGKFHPVALASSPYWRDSVPETIRKSYITFGERYLHHDWPSLPATLFAEFKTQGNRVHYEAASFEKRRQLAALVMAEVSEGKGRFTDDIVNGLWSFFEETWWGLPAHYGHPYPIPEDQNVDLFNAETASLVAWSVYMLSDQLETRSPLILKRATKEIDRRILTPALTGKYWWKTAGMNWNPWICSNWLTCALLFEQDRQRQLQAVEQILGCLDAFMDAYPDDGGCDEGPGYWDRAAASLFESLQLLHLATNGRIDLSHHAKLQAMGSYIYKTYIGNGYCTNFADAHDNKAVQQVNIVYPFGLYLNDGMMRGFGKYLWKGDEQAAESYAVSGNFPTLGRELLFLKHITTFEKETAREPLLSEVWLPNLQIMTTRDSKGLFLAMKGGNNGESHNHNDVGSFIVYADGKPLLIDVGVGEYTSKTFSNDRYSIWTMQSGYHNLPQINGCDQKDGKSYRAEAAHYTKGSLTLDIAHAYPDEAKVSQWKRTARLLRGKHVEITEDYILQDYQSPSRLMLITPVKPEVSKGKIILGEHQVSYPSDLLDIEVEELSNLLDPLLEKVWGKEMYRIVMTIKSHATKGKVTYRIR